MKKILAIDPDIEKCGVCEMVDGEIVDLFTLSPEELIMRIIGGHYYVYNYAVEDTERNKAIYTKNRKQSSKVNEKIAMSIGKVQGVTRLLINIIELKTKKKPILAPPGVGRQVKDNAKYFKELTGWEGSTNSDMRDAYAIARYANNRL